MPDSTPTRFSTLNGRQVELADGYFATRRGTPPFLSVAIPDVIRLAEWGFQHDRRTKILFDEYYYLEGRGFQIYCLESPFDGGRTITKSVSSMMVHLPANKTPSECREFFHSFPENSLALQHLDTQLLLLLNGDRVSSMGSLDAVSAEMLRIFDAANDALLSSNWLFQSLQSSRQQQERLEQYLETYIMGTVHLPIFLMCIMESASADNDLVQLMEGLNDLCIQEFVDDKRLAGMPDSALDGAVQALAMLDDYNSPAEKRNCIAAAFGAIVQATDKYMQETNAMSHCTQGKK